MKDEHDTAALGLDKVDTVIVELSRLLVRCRAEGQPGAAGLIQAASAYMIRAGQMLDGRLLDVTAHGRLRRLGEMIRHQDSLDYHEFLEAMLGAGFPHLDVTNLHTTATTAHALKANGYVTGIEFETLKVCGERITRVGRIWPKREVHQQEKSA